MKFETISRIFNARISEEKKTNLLTEIYCEKISIREYVKSSILFQSAFDGRREKYRTRAQYPDVHVPMPLIISLATELVVIVEHSCEGTHWYYSVPSERLTRGTFHSAVRANDTRAPATFTEKKCAALVQPVVVRIVSSFKQLFATLVGLFA